MFKYIPIFLLFYGCQSSSSNSSGSENSEVEISETETPQDSEDLETETPQDSETETSQDSEISQDLETETSQDSETIQISEESQTKILDNEVVEVELKDLNDPLYKYQWHLANLNVESVWSRYRGEGIRVGVIDSGVEYDHQDLLENMNLDYSYRYSDGSNDPSPDKSQLSEDSLSSGHGTACAGIIGAIGWNGEGVVGVAPEVEIVGFNAFSSGLDADFEDALGNLNVDISSNSWGSGNEQYFYDDPSSLRGVEYGVKNGRDGKGIIYLFAAGNEAYSINHSTLHGSKYVFNIGAVDINDAIQDYSNYGDNILVVTYGGSYEGGVNNGIFTTDLQGLLYGFEQFGYVTDVLKRYLGDYTGAMNGTSSAVPIVSGIVALILDANPNLTYRDVKYILIKSSEQKNLEEEKYLWSKNGAGVWYSQYYGFGLIDLEEAIKMAETFENLSTEKVISAQNSPFLDINDFTTTNSYITISNDITIEHTEIIVDIDHGSVEDLEIVVTSPSGTESTLAYGDLVLYGEYSNWSLNSLRFLDESSKGVWKIQIYDNQKEFTGKLRSWKLNISGR
jgi:hypothetical protein